MVESLAGWDSSDGLCAFARGGLAVATLFDPLKVGELVLPNRIVMAPLTRLRGTVKHLPTETRDPRQYVGMGSRS